MGAIATITINDGQATPVVHNFAPQSIDQNGVATYFDRSGSVPIGYPRITVSLRAPLGSTKGTKADRVFKAIVTVDVPTLESVAPAGNGYTPAPTVAYVTAFRGEFLLPERGSLQERKNLLAYVKNFFGNSVAVSVLENLETIY